MDRRRTITRARLLPFGFIPPLIAAAVAFIYFAEADYDPHFRYKTVLHALAAATTAVFGLWFPVFLLTSLASGRTIWKHLLMSLFISIVAWSAIALIGNRGHDFSVHDFVNLLPLIGGFWLVYVVLLIITCFAYVALQRIKSKNTGAI